MLKITIPAQEGYNNETGELINNKHDVTICLEHSLVSISKWESKCHKPFLIYDKKSKEELINYIRCMTTSQISDETYYLLTEQNIKEINAYIDNPMSATTFTNNKLNQSPITRRNEVLTSEIIYYWMINFQIPLECQKWHLNRLMTLIRVCNNKNDPKKMSKKDTMMSNKALNEARRKQLNSRG